MKTGTKRVQADRSGSKRGSSAGLNRPSQCLERISERLQRLTQLSLEADREVALAESQKILGELVLYRGLLKRMV